MSQKIITDLASLKKFVDCGRNAQAAVDKLSRDHETEIKTELAKTPEERERHLRRVVENIGIIATTYETSTTTDMRRALRTIRNMANFGRQA